MVNQEISEIQNKNRITMKRYWFFETDKCLASTIINKKKKKEHNQCKRMNQVPLLILDIESTVKIHIMSNIMKINSPNQMKSKDSLKNTP